MAQQTSETWKRLWKTKNTIREYAFDVNGEWYDATEEVTHSVESGLYEDFGIGNTYSATLKLSLFADDIPRGAVIKRYVRLRNGDEVSEWLPKGVFFTNRRSADDNYWTIEAFDIMRKTEVVWTPSQSLNFPMSMESASKLFAQMIGTTVDSRSQFNNYTIDYPANDYTIRQELQFIAAAHGGNWIVTDEGKLLLVPLLSIPEDTNYLVDEYGDNIIIGGDRILVG